MGADTRNATTDRRGGSPARRCLPDGFDYQLTIPRVDVGVCRQRKDCGLKLCCSGDGIGREWRPVVQRRGFDPGPVECVPNRSPSVRIVNDEWVSHVLEIRESGNRLDVADVWTVG